MQVNQLKSNMDASKYGYKLFIINKTLIYIDTSSSNFN